MDIIFTIVSVFFNLVSLLIPNWFIPMSITNALDSIIISAMSVNSFLPIADLLIGLSIILWFHILRFTYNIATGIISLVRGGGGNQI